MPVKYHHDLDQGSDEWKAVRCGLLTASEMKHIITPKTLKYSASKEERCHLYELAAQRVTKYVEPHYISDDMLRGVSDEVDAKILYDKNYAKVESVGFVTNDKWGFTIGYSPDGLIGEDGLIECKSRRQKFQIETILNGSMPDDYMIQVQTGLLVSERKWLDFISYSGGMPMMTVRIYPEEKYQEAILGAAKEFHEKLDFLVEKYSNTLEAREVKLIPTERRIEQEITL